MTIYVNIMPKENAPDLGPLVVALIYDGLCAFEFGIVTEIFGLDRPEMGPGWYRFASCALDDGPLRMQGGLTLYPDGNPELLDQADLIVIPGWKGTQAPVPEALTQKLCDAHRRGARLASICSGAFVLAATGLLDGTTVTTHWRYADELRRQHPQLQVDEKSLYRGEDRIFTSAGSAAGIDLLIEIVRQDFGSDTANSVARRMVMPAHRNGGQAQFLEKPVPQHQTAEIAPLLDQMRENIARQWRVAELAVLARMSHRTFLRRFAEATGATPGKWLVSERVDAAKQLLCSTELTIEQIAGEVGMGSAHVLRHHFRKLVKLNPTEFRLRFRTHG